MDNHRVFISSVQKEQVMLFADRLEVWNPGTLPSTLTLEKLRHSHGSVPGNPLLAEPLYLTKYIERMGTGILDMIELCRKAGLKEPEFKLTDGFVTTIRRKPERAIEIVTGQVTEEIRRVVLALHGDMSRKQIQDILRLNSHENFEERYLKPTLESGYIGMTISDKPNSLSINCRQGSRPMRVMRLIMLF
ncbi:hypothetical protein AUJ95_04005 [Candidatus Desantisbacteria bacterium CG2_30_40_21]|uniref:Filamentation induced by cAMP protein Fic-like C-terminal domain-containing protein n=5 Tax=unclassified Candidatus Desantisiibacteriota TaxID=3106372 RepID=A0A2M7JA11_9BACT|nr:MAG: hypothetical protein AUJ95_04005 [Candidatus Desantisbacteria bacterium CG2_30_40_21]PIP40343.1 MAG: hypothetical protein COX18_07025 [Candidatus Desantisbacteria bacterium CG23_combo_of_CG06-09_8_20_14_all_40_23]PIX16248.1 MAG: hypothetical protein COZ71_08240 [Candidatus Desantisbacteria bacterium CG_4_8_14_3_um_filter_40_12]PIY19834.1 MAG: hypothetical protein COZ13_03265 [Candidatus Desantisbacteria bacterium CG_4_10_14_3_um_filter_40_18]PJB28107.1 MAG: hypothetical protein CO110_10